MTLLYYKEP